MSPDLLQALARPAFSRWFGYQLSPSIEAEFEAESRDWRIGMLRRWMVAGFLFSWVACVLQLLDLQHWALPLLLQLLLVTPITLLSYGALDPRRRRRLETPAAIAPICVSLLTGVVGMLCEGPPGFLPAMTILCMGCLWTNTLIPNRLRATLWCTILTIGLGDAMLAAFALRHGLPPGPVAVPFHGMVALSLLARFFAERELRLTFVRGLALRKRADELTRSNEALIAMANTDPLTGLSNRRYFDQRLAEVWSEAGAADQSLAILMIDIDHFKRFNDAAGHLEGDRCLAVIAKAVAAEARQRQDVAARFGGEEFIVLAPQADEVAAREIAERIRVAVEALEIFHPNRPDGRFVSVSIGVAAGRPNSEGADPSVLVNAADVALYAAKQAGRGRVRTRSASRRLAAV